MSAAEYDAYLHERRNPVSYEDCEPQEEYISKCGRYTVTIVDTIDVLTPCGTVATVIRGFIDMPHGEPYSFIERLHPDETTRNRISHLTRTLEGHRQIDNIPFRLDCVAQRLRALVTE